MSRRWAIAGGGTGGHVTPALALGEELRRDGDDILFLGTRRGLEVKLVPEAGFELEALDARPFVGRSALDRLRALFALVGATARARRILRRFGAELVLSVGGYASVPAALAAVLTRIPVVLVNTDATPGRANRLLARFAARIYVGFPAAAEKLGGQSDRVRVSGVPLREGLRRAFEGAEDPDKADERRHLFVFGGSQGARQINEAMMELLPTLDPDRVSVVHQTGESDRERVEAAYRNAGIESEVLAFVRDMPARYRWADLVLCRAGAISIAELTLAGRPAVLVPLAHVGGGEQFENAGQLERMGAARVLDSRNLTAAELARELAELLGDPERLREMGARAASLARPRAARQIVDECRELMDPNGGERSA